MRKATGANLAHMTQLFMTLVLGTEIGLAFSWQIGEAEADGSFKGVYFIVYLGNRHPLVIKKSQGGLRTVCRKPFDGEGARH